MTTSGAPATPSSSGAPATTSGAPAASSEETGGGELCGPPAPAEVYGPCDGGACAGTCLLLGGNSVCTTTCEDVSDCETCSPDGAKVTCVARQCVVQCTLGGATCPAGMLCDAPTNFCAWAAR